MIENERYEAADSIMKSNNYQSSISKIDQLGTLWYYYYNNKKYTKALGVLKDSIYINEYLMHTRTFAQMGNRKKVDSMNKRHPWGYGSPYAYDKHKAFIHAALKDTDSMYFYLNRIEGHRILEVNGSPDFDPYRNEARYKSILRKNYIPVPGE